MAAQGKARRRVHEKSDPISHIIRKAFERILSPNQPHPRPRYPQFAAAQSIERRLYNHLTVTPTRDLRATTTEQLLREAASKLERIQKERFVKHFTIVEAFCERKSPEELEKIDWFDYSVCQIYYDSDC